MRDNPETDARSISGRRWQVLPADPGATARLRAAGVAPIAARLMASRGLDRDSHAVFLDPKLRDLMPDPDIFLDMPVAARRLADAIRSDETIGIWSDYDADGATSAAVLGWFLRMCGRPDFRLRIPDRIREGYGPNGPGLIGMKADGCTLVCVLDAGITAFEPLAEARAADLDVVVIDHHAAEDRLPEAVAVLNANRKDQPPGYGHLCAAGMTFVLTIAVTRLLQRDGYFDGKDGRPADRPELMRLLDLVALGTVCDVVPLTGLNRAFVRQGLRVMNRRERPGLRALAEVAGLAADAPLTERECGWVFGPRINAGGRIGASDSGARLLLESCPDLALEKARSLDALNADRKAMEAATTERAIAALGGRAAGIDRSLALAVVEEAHEGVVGISAARVREAFDAPAVVLSRAHDGSLKGSARSVPGVDIGHVIIAARNAGLLVKGGGHGMAGGLTILPEKVGAFIEFANDCISRTDYWQDGILSEADLSLRLADLGVDAIRSLDQVAPWGTANPEPRVLLSGVVISDIRILKQKHFKLRLSDGGAAIDGMMWGIVGTPLQDRVEDLRGRSVDALGSVSVNVFRGNETPQMVVSDLRPAKGVLI